MEDKESVEDLIIVAINRALEKAEKISEIEMKGVANNVMPDIQNMFVKKKFFQKIEILFPNSYQKNFYCKK